MKRTVRTLVTAVSLSAVALVGVGGTSPATAAPALAKADCKAGGHHGLTRGDGSSFKNQGACVSYAARGGELLHKRASKPAIKAIFTANQSTSSCAVEVRITGLLPNTQYTFLENRVVNGSTQNGSPYVFRTDRSGAFTLSGTDFKGVSVTHTVVGVVSAGPTSVSC